MGGHTCRITADEVEDAVWKMKKAKATGPTGVVMLKDADGVGCDKA